MAQKEQGYVYILTNPSFRKNWVKNGKSSCPVDVRSKELDNTAVPWTQSEKNGKRIMNYLLYKFI